MLFSRWGILFTGAKQVSLDLLPQHGHNSERIHHFKVLVNSILMDLERIK